MEQDGLIIPDEHAKEFQAIVNNVNFALNSSHASAYLCILENFRMTLSDEQLTRDPMFSVMKLLLIRYGIAKKLTKDSAPPPARKTDVEIYTKILNKNGQT